MALILHDRLSSRTRITATVVTRTALHLGSGRQSEQTDAAVLRDAADRPLIPGSSLKGALRSAVDRLLPGEPGAGLPWSCRLERPHSICLTNNTDLQQRFNEALREEQRAPTANPSGRKPNQPPWLELLSGMICDVCAAFGSVAYAGRIRVLDLPVVGIWAETTEIRDGVGIDRDSRTAVPAIKFDLEVVPAGTGFALEIVADNLDPVARFVLAVALAELRAGRVRLGGRTTRGLGSVELSGPQIDELDLGGDDPRASLRRYLVGDSASLSRRDVDTWITDALDADLSAHAQD